MRMTGDKYGNLWKFQSQCHDAICKIVTAAAGFQSHVTSENNRVCAFALCSRDRATDGLDGMLKLNSTSKLRAKPKRHARRCNSNNRNFDSSDLLQDKGLDFCERMLRIRKFTGRLALQQRVRSQDWHCRSLQGLLKRRDSPVELMIADNPCVVFEMIEQVDHQFAFAAQADFSALINIPDIDQDGISILSPPTPDLRNATRHSTTIRTSVVIGSWQNITVKIRRVENRDANCV